MDKEKKPIELKCQRCEHVWKYTGDAEYWTSCPYCKTSVSVRQNQVPGDLPAQKT